MTQKIRKHLVTGVVGTLLAMLCLSLFSGLKMAALAKAQAADEKTIKVGYIDYNGFITKTEQGDFIGYGVEYLQEISQYTGWKYEYVYDNWSNQLEALKEGKIDLICHAQKTPEREENYLYSKYSDGSESSVLYVRGDEERYYYNDYSAFDGMKVAFLENSFQNAEFATYAEHNGFSYTASEYPSEEACFNALEEKKVDAVAMGSLASKKGYKVVSRFGADPFYFITGKQNRDLMEELDYAQGEVMGESPTLLTQLFDEYYGNSVANSSLMLTREEADFIAEDNTFTVGNLPARYPFSTYDEKTGELTGITEDMLDKIAEISGLHFEYQPLELSEQPINALKAQKFDLVAGILKNEKFDKDPELNVSDAYIQSTLAIVMRKNSQYNSTQAYTVVIPDSFQAMKEYIHENYANYTVMKRPTQEECIKAVQDGEADIFMQNVNVVNYLLQKPMY
ncbi:MAG: transporter substrate-binding domain-containing protein [Lachnospiraceae bacterium]|nr:transporter substrate-binding domain-containing protein [Lachnospiraceae bacterium]